MKPEAAEVVVDPQIVASMEAQLDEEKRALRAEVHDLGYRVRVSEQRIERLLSILEKLAERGRYRD